MAAPLPLKFSLLKSDVYLLLATEKIASRKHLLLLSFHIHLFIWYAELLFIPPISESYSSTLRQNAHFLPESIQTFIIIHFLCYCVFLINLMYCAKEALFPFFYFIFSSVSSLLESYCNNFFPQF